MTVFVDFIRWILLELTEVDEQRCVTQCERKRGKGTMEEYRMSLVISFVQKMKGFTEIWICLSFIVMQNGGAMNG